MHARKHARAWKRSGCERSDTKRDADRKKEREGEREGGGMEGEKEGEERERRTYYTISRLRKRFCQLYVATGVHSRIARALQPPHSPLPARTSITAPSVVPAVAATTARLCVPRCMPFVTIQDGDAECRASFATSRRGEDSPSRSLGGGRRRARRASGTFVRAEGTALLLRRCDGGCENFR